MILRLFCVVSPAVIHELGHILAAKLCGVRSWRFGLKAGGALITFDFSRLSYMREVFVHLAGPAFGVLSALFSVIFFGERAEYFAGVSLSMALVNLLPVSGFDGGGGVDVLSAGLVVQDMPRGVVLYFRRSLGRGCAVRDKIRREHRTACFHGCDLHEKLHLTGHNVKTFGRSFTFRRY